MCGMDKRVMYGMVKQMTCVMSRLILCEITVAMKHGLFNPFNRFIDFETSVK